MDFQPKTIVVQIISYHCPVQKVEIFLYWIGSIVRQRINYYNHIIMTIDNNFCIRASQLQADVVMHQQSYLTN